MLVFNNVIKAVNCWYNFLRYGSSFNRPTHNYLMVSYRFGKARWTR